MADEQRSAGATITIGGEEVGRVLGFSESDEISEEEVAGLSDTVGDPPIIKEQYIPTSIGSTGSLNGICIIDDSGQAAVETAKDTGAEVVLEIRYEDQSGKDLTVFFTSYEKTAEKPDTVKFSSDFRINDKANIAPPA